MNQVSVLILSSHTDNCLFGSLLAFHVKLSDTTANWFSPSTIKKRENLNFDVCVNKLIDVRDGEVAIFIYYCLLS